MSRVNRHRVKLVHRLSVIIMLPTRTRDREIIRIRTKTISSNARSETLHVMSTKRTRVVTRWVLMRTSASFDFSEHLGSFRISVLISSSKTTTRCNSIISNNVADIATATTAAAVPATTMPTTIIWITTKTITIISIREEWFKVALTEFAT